MPNVRRLKSMLSLQEFYTWRWIIQERRKAEAGDKTAFSPSDAELAEAYLKRKKDAGADV